MAVSCSLLALPWKPTSCLLCLLLITPCTHQPAASHQEGCKDRVCKEGVKKGKPNVEAALLEMIKSGPGNLYSAIPCVGHDEAPAAGLLLDGWRLLEDSHSLTKPWGFAQGSGKHFLSCNMGPPGDAASRQEG